MYAIVKIIERVSRDYIELIEFQEYFDKLFKGDSTGKDLGSYLKQRINSIIVIQIIPKKEEAMKTQ